MTKSSSKPSLPKFNPGSESSQIGEQKVEEILLLAKKRSLENPKYENGLSMTPVQTAHSELKFKKNCIFAGQKRIFFTLLKVQKHIFLHFQKYKNTYIF